MPVIIIDNLYNKKINLDAPGQVLKSLQENYIDWMHSCGGKGRCTTCKMEVLKGENNLSPLSPFEQKCREKKALGQNERLACQCLVKGDIVVRVPEANKLPHMDYSD